MENAVDALKMAAAIVIFVIAVSSSFSIFGIAKQTADSIITMEDKQAYLQSAELEGTLYTTPSSLGETQFTDKGDRIVNIDDVVSTIYRYSKEKYGVSIIDVDGSGKGTVRLRFDTNTETYINNYNNLVQQKSDFFTEYQKIVAENLKTEYCSDVQFYNSGASNKIENLYSIKYDNNTKTNYGAPWLIDEVEIVERINCDLRGKNYEYQGQERLIEDIDDGNGLISFLNNKQAEGKKIVEVTNEIDNNKYLTDGTTETNLLQQYNMPTVEIVYVIID